MNVTDQEDSDAEASLYAEDDAIDNDDSETEDLPLARHKTTLSRSNVNSKPQPHSHEEDLTSEKSDVEEAYDATGSDNDMLPAKQRILGYNYFIARNWGINPSDMYQSQCFFPFSPCFQQDSVPILHGGLNQRATSRGWANFAALR